MYMYTHTYLHTYTHTYIHTQTHTHTHTHTHHAHSTFEITTRPLIVVMFCVFLVCFVRLLTTAQAIVKGIGLALKSLTNCAVFVTSIPRFIFLRVVCGVCVCARARMGWKSPTSCAVFTTQTPRFIFLRVFVKCSTYT